MTLTRTHLLAAAAASGAFLAYGSLVPFHFQPQPLGAALHAFGDALTPPMRVDSRADFVTNVLLTVPLTFLLLGAFRFDRRGRFATTLASGVTFATSLALSFLVEFLQNFFPGRTNALSDIVAQTGGALVGIVGWLVAGQTTVSWLRATLAERERGAFAQRALLAYSVVLAVSQVMPLDLTINLGELAGKYRRGGVLLVPFQWMYESRIDQAWDLAGDTLLNVPLGAAALVALMPFGRRRSVARALFIGLSAVIGIELAQVFVMSRIADATDVLTGGIGVVMGVAIAALVSRAGAFGAPGQAANEAAFEFGGAPASVSVRGGGATSDALSANPWYFSPWMWRAGVVGYVALLASYHWNPFNFTTTPERVTVGMHQLLQAPFSSYYVGTEFHAFTEMWRKALLAAPLGPLLFMSWHARSRVPAVVRGTALAVVGAALLLLLELGQVLLPTRVPDVTDVFIGDIGVVAAMWLTQRAVGRRPAAQKST